MKKFILLLAFVYLPVCAEQIEYGFNAHGEYVPVRYGDKEINYGYNEHVDYVPTSIDDRRIYYGYNAYGQYVPTEIEDVEDWE